MSRRIISMVPLIASAAAVMVASATLSAQAGSTGNGTAGSGFSQYSFETDANRLCKGDTVVWGSSANKGIYFVTGAGPYTATGKRIGGFYACMADVKKAGYKIGQ
jgi:hypothetical protein